MSLPKEIKAKGKVQFQKKAYQRTYSIDEIRQILNLNEKTCRRMAKAMLFPNLKIGSRIIVPCEAFDHWFDNLTLENMVEITEKYAKLNEGENS